MPKDLMDAMHDVLMADVKLSWQDLPFFLGSLHAPAELLEPGAQSFSVGKVQHAPA